MQLILDENLPPMVKEELEHILPSVGLTDIAIEHKGLLDMEIAELMEDDDILVTADREFHRNILKLGGNSIYYDIQLNNLVEVQIKTSCYLKGYPAETVEKTSVENQKVTSGPNALLRKRFDELKEENSRLKVRVNVLEGKLRSIYLTALSATENEG